MGTKELGDNSGFLATWYKQRLQVQNYLSKLRCFGGVWAEIIFPFAKAMSAYYPISRECSEGVGKV